MIVAIHQPDFFPWIGYYMKIVKSDLYVCLDHVEMNVKTAGWIKRVKVINASKDSWITIPLIHPKDSPFQKINEMKVDLKDPSYLKSKQILYNSYKKAKHFNEVYPLIEKYFNLDTDSLMEKNMEFNISVFKMLNIDTELCYSSSMELTKQKGDLVMEILQKCSATTYISGTGGKSYQDESEFVKNNITLQYNEVNIPAYSQFNSSSFIPNMSILDLAFNMGFEKIKQYFI